MLQDIEMVEMHVAGYISCIYTLEDLIIHTL